MVPQDKGCNTWAELQAKMEEEIREVMIPKPALGSGLLTSMRAPVPSTSVKMTHEPDFAVTPSYNPKHEAYCVKCKAKRRMGSAIDVELKNRRKALKGICPECGTGMFKILGRA